MPRPIPRSAFLAWGMLLLMTCTATASAEGFWDVPPTSPYAHAYAALLEQRIIQGSADGLGRPFAPITRVEALKAVIRSREQYALQIVWFTENLPALPLFPDIDQTAWYAPYAEVGFLEGMMTGFPDGTFRPGTPLTIEEALVLLRRASERTNAVAYRTSPDLPNIPGQWYTDAVSEAIDRNLIAEGSALEIGETISRGAFFIILDRLRTIETKRAYSFTEESTMTPMSLKTRETPLRITPLPLENFKRLTSGTNLLREADPFTLRLPGISGQTERTKSSSAVYASTKPFAITIPRLDIIDVTVTHPSDPFSEEGILAVLRDGLGHLFSYPGSTGKTMIYAHSSSWPWDRSDFARAFRQVNALSIGERVYVTYNRKLYVYEVTRKQIVDAKDTAPFNDDGTEELILYTCWPPDSTESRYLVHAMRVETVALR